MSRAILFIDRDGTLIAEPEDEQVDSLEKLALVPGVIPALLRLRDSGYRFVVVSNQDGLGTPSFPTADYERVHTAFIELFASQGIEFDEVLVCPHRPEDGCACRKPSIGLMRDTLIRGFDAARSFVIGDRESDIGLAENLGIQGLLLKRNGTMPANDSAMTWPDVVQAVKGTLRTATHRRATKETQIDVTVTLDREGPATVSTGIGFLDHMLEQLSRHGGFALDLQVQGDLHIDDHHTVEDTALALGTALSRALGERAGIGRYGCSLPMDESAATALIDLSGRSLLRFEGTFPQPLVGTLSTEMVPHFFRSLADAMDMTLHVEVRGENTHHMVEGCFKAVARALRPALALTGSGQVPSTKGVL